MTILAGGGEQDAFTWPSTQPGSANWTTSGSLYDSNYCAGGMMLSGTTMNARSTLVTSGQLDIWVHLQEYYTTTNAGSSVPFITLYTSGGTGVLRLYQSSSTARVLQYWSGSAWTTIGSSFSMTTGALANIDIHCKIDASAGIMELYVDSVLKASLSGATSFFGGSSVSYIEMSPTHSTNSNNQAWSQFICADVDTRSMKLATIRPNAAGATSQWSGTYTDIDDVGYYTDSDYITSGTANQVSTFGLTDLSTAAQALDPLGVIVTGRARKGTTGPQNLQLGVHSGSTDYFAANEPSLGSSFGNLTPRIWDQNPDTSAAWTVSEIQSLQAGVKSIT